MGMPSVPLQATFMPVCWSTKSSNVTEWDGIWRVGGTGMIAFYIGDLYTGSGFTPRGMLPMVNKTSWGNEDIALTKAFEASGLTSVRPCVPQLWHIFHPKNSWGASYDGVHREKAWRARARAIDAGVVDYTASKEWQQPFLVDGPGYLARSNSSDVYRCRAKHAQRVYNKQWQHLQTLALAAPQVITTPG